MVESEIVDGVWVASAQRATAEYHHARAAVTASRVDSAGPRGRRGQRDCHHRRCRTFQRRCRRQLVPANRVHARTPYDYARSFRRRSKRSRTAPSRWSPRSPVSVIGGALELAMACHYRVAGSSSRFTMPEVRLGINPGAGGTQRLPRLVGPAAALKMLLTAETVDAQRALALGLVDAVCPSEQVVSTRPGPGPLLSRAQKDQPSRPTRSRTRRSETPRFKRQSNCSPPLDRRSSLPGRSSRRSRRAWKNRTRQVCRRSNRSLMSACSRWRRGTRSTCSLPPERPARFPNWRAKRPLR